MLQITMKRTVSLILSVILALFLFSCGTGQEIKADFTVYCFNAGAADSFLIRTKNSAVLIDTAESSFGDEITDYLSSQGIERLDFSTENKDGKMKSTIRVMDLDVNLVSLERGEEKFTEFLEGIAETAQTDTILDGFAEKN